MYGVVILTAATAPVAFALVVVLNEPAVTCIDSFGAKPTAVTVIGVPAVVK